MRLIVYAVLLVLTPPALRAAEVSRCVAADGHVTFTSGKGPEGTKLTASTPYTPERVSTPRTWQSEYNRQTRIFQGDDADAGEGSYYRKSGKPKSRTWKDTCREARELVQEQRLRTRNPTYDDQRRWNDIEFSACQGRNPDR